MLDLCWLGGFIDAEGCFMVQRSVQRSGSIRFRPAIKFGNSDPATVDAAAAIAQACDLHYNVYGRRTSPYREIVVYNYTQCRAWLAILLPVLRTKSADARLLAEYCAFATNTHLGTLRPYGERELEILRALGVASTGQRKRRRHARPTLEHVPIEYDPAALSERDLAWLAGFMDGEATLWLDQRKFRPNTVATLSGYPLISVINVHVPTLGYVCAILGWQGIPYSVSHTKNPGYWTVRVFGKKRCSALLGALLPHFRLLRHDASLLDAYCRTSL